MPQKKSQKKSVASFFTAVSPEERAQVLRQAVRESNQDQKEILDYYRKEKLKNT